MTSLHIGMYSSSLPEEDRKPGGVDVLVDRLANRLVDAGHRVTVFSYSPAPSDARYVVRQLQPASWRHRKLYRMFVLPALLNRLDADGIDVLHLHGDDWFYVRRHTATVRTFYGSALDEMRTATRRRRRAAQAVIFCLELAAARLATASYGLIPGDGKWYRTRGSLGCGVDPVPPGERSSTPTVLFVGTWHGRKRGRKLAEAFGRDVIPRIPDARLVMVSDEAENAPWIDFVARPRDDELRELYATAWLFCLPSSYEGLGIPYLEAMAAGTPTVATPNPGSMYLLRNGADGVIVDMDELGPTIRALLQDGEAREALSRAGRDRAAAFSWDSICEAHLVAYGDAISRSRVSRR